MLLEGPVGVESSFGQQGNWSDKDGKVEGLKHDGKGITSLTTGSTNSRVIITT